MTYMHWKTKKCISLTLFLIFTLLKWTETKPAISPRYTCSYIKHKYVLSVHLTFNFVYSIFPRAQVSNFHVGKCIHFVLYGLCFLCLKNVFLSPVIKILLYCPLCLLLVLNSASKTWIFKTSGIFFCIYYEVGINFYFLCKKTMA